MIRFGSPGFLLLGLGLVLVTALAWWRYERKRDRRLAAFAGGLGRSLARAEADAQRHLRWGLRVFGLLALVVAAAGPRWGVEVVRVAAQGSDLVLVFDTSASMDARDVPPTRLEEAKREALALLEDLGGDRVGVVAVAGDAVALSPLTLDRSAVRLLLESLNSDVVSTPGSDLGRGLRTALRLLPEGEAGQQAIILFTDGEDLEGGLGEATTTIEQRGVRVFAVGVGTPAGETIPILDERGYQVGVKTDTNGQPVVSRLDVNALRLLARRTHGSFFAAPHPGGELARLRGAVAGVGKSTREGRLGSRPVERFPLFALVAWLAFVASWLLPARATVLPRALVRRTRRAAAGLVLAATTAGLLGAPGVAHAVHPLVEGNRLYAAGDYKGAIRVYQEALKKSPDDPALHANLGAALYRSNDWKGAEEAFARAQAASGGKPAVAARAGQGRGNALFRQERYREALDAYRQALEARPDDADARFNYELTLRKLRPKDEPPQPSPQPPNEPQSGGGGGGGGGGAGQPPTPPQNAPRNARQTPQNPEPAGDPGQLSRAEAERLLEALQNGERQARAQQQRARGRETPRERDW